jgi:hypothetical protein
MIAAYRHLEEARTRLHLIFQGKDGAMILRRLRAVFPDADSAISFELLATYLAGAQLALVQWWLEKHQPYTAENSAQIFHRLQRAALCDAFGISDK